MRRTIIVVENQNVVDELWITPSGIMTKELSHVLDLIKTGKAGRRAYERYVSKDETIVTLLTESRTTREQGGIDYDSLVKIPYSQEE